MLSPFKVSLFAMALHAVLVCEAREELSFEYGQRWISEVVSERSSEWNGKTAVFDVIADSDGVIWAASSVGVYVLPTAT